MAIDERPTKCSRFKLDIEKKNYYSPGKQYPDENRTQHYTEHFCDMEMRNNDNDVDLFRCVSFNLSIRKQKFRWMNQTDCDDQTPA